MNNISGTSWYFVESSNARYCQARYPKWIYSNKWCHLV